jgi:hypothetical protein
MTNIKNFEIVKATLLEKKEAIQKQIDALCDESKGEVTELFKEVFAEQLASYADVELKANNNAVAFRIKRKDICNIYSRSYFNRTGYYLNTYATSVEDEFEYKRMIFNGKIAERILSNPDLVQETFDAPFSKKAELNALQEEFYAIEGEIRNQNNKIQEAKKDEVMIKLMGEGMEWEPGKTFELNRQWSSYQVKKVKVLNATKSGKTVDLEVTYAQYDWIADEEGNSVRVDIEDRIVTHEKIKMEYVMGNFRDAIYKY